MFLSLSIFLSHRSSTRQRHGRCSKCLRRLTKSCMRGEAVEEGYSRGCRMNVSSGPHVSHIFGTFPSNFLTFHKLVKTWQQRDHCWVGNLRKNIPHLYENFIPLLMFSLCVCVGVFVSFRIQGTQLVCPSDEGFQWYATSVKGTSVSNPSAGKDSSVKSQEKMKGSSE